MRRETGVGLGQDYVGCDNLESSFHLEIALSQHCLCVKLNGNNADNGTELV